MSPSRLQDTRQTYKNQLFSMKQKKYMDTEI